MLFVRGSGANTRLLDHPLFIDTPMGHENSHRSTDRTFDTFSW